MAKFGYKLWYANDDRVPQSWGSWILSVFDGSMRVGEVGGSDVYRLRNRRYDEETEFQYSYQVLQDIDYLRGATDWNGWIMASMPRNEDAVDDSWVWKRPNDYHLLQAMHPYGSGFHGEGFEGMVEEANFFCRWLRGQGWNHMPKAQVYHPMCTRQELPEIIGVHEMAGVPLVLDLNRVMDEELQHVVGFAVGVPFYEIHNGDDPDPDVDPHPLQDDLDEAIQLLSDAYGQVGDVPGLGAMIAGRKKLKKIIRKVRNL